MGKPFFGLSRYTHHNWIFRWWENKEAVSLFTKVYVAFSEVFRGWLYENPFQRGNYTLISSNHVREGEDRRKGGVIPLCNLEEEHRSMKLFGLSYTGLDRLSELLWIEVSYVLLSTLNVIPWVTPNSSGDTAEDKLYCSISGLPCIIKATYWIEFYYQIITLILPNIPRGWADIRWH